MSNIYITGEPEDGTLTLGAVYYILKTKEIYEATGLKPIGYVIDVDDEVASKSIKESK